MKRMRQSEDRLFDYSVTAMVSLFFLMVAYPLYFIIIGSFSDPSLVGSGQVFLLPKRITLAAYRKVIEYDAIWTGYRNTIVYTFVFTVLSLFMTITGGYGLSRKGLPGRNAIMGFMTFTMFFNGGLVPTYFLIRSLNLIGNPVIVMLLGSVSVYNIIIARTFMQSNIPDELFEAAMMDGCGHFRFLARVVIPLSTALIAVMTIFAAVAQWNSWFNAMMYLRDVDLMPLQLVLRNIIISVEQFMQEMGMGALGEDTSNLAATVEGMKYAVIIVSTVPVLCLYPLVQRYFVKGIMIGSIKG